MEYQAIGACLFIQGFLQPADMRFSPMNLKALQLLNIFLLLYNPIEKCGLHIHLVDLPTHLCCNGDYCSDRRVMRNWCKGLVIIYSLYLWEFLCHKMSFVLLNTTVRSMLDRVKPPRSHNWLFPQSRYNLPNIILHNGMILLHQKGYPGLPGEVINECNIVLKTS